MEWPDKRFEYLAHIASAMSKGRGCGTGAGYRAWCDFRSRPRIGTERAFKCSKTGRMVNHRSGAHKTYFLLNERRSCVVSIEEDFPLLNMANTARICQQLGVAHPTKKNLPEPLVVSFLIREVRNGKTVAVARSLSGESPLARHDATHLDAIQQACDNLGLEWKWVDTTALDETILNSLIFARAWMQRRFKPDGAEVQHFAATFLKLHSRAKTLTELLEACTARLDLTIAKADTLFRYAAWTGAIAVDFSFKLARNEVVRLLRNGRS